MKERIILTTATRFIMPMLLLLSAFLLLRGHNLPGGGFIGGLLASSAFALYAFAFNVEEARRMLRFDPRTLIGIGLLVALGSGAFALFQDAPFMTGFWGTFPWGWGDVIKVGTPVIFDVGIYLVVVGAILAIILTLAERE